MLETYSGHPVPEEPLIGCLTALFRGILSSPDGFSRWRYESDAGTEQLRGLTPEQIDLWRRPWSMDHGDRFAELRSHEDANGEFGFFWATKVGGPSHGFDFEGQCLLPLLANARHKVVLVTAEEFPHNPCGRAHFRLLWVAGTEPPKAVLWLEGVHMDFGAGRVPRLDGAVLEHAV